MTADSTIQTGLTTAGHSILTQAQLGASITFTKVKIGDGELGTLNPATLTDLINPLQELGIYDKSKVDEQNISITALITQGETGYTFREIGLFAIDPETQLEVLYAYGNKGDIATYIPSNISSISVEEEATIIVEVANASNVVVNISREYSAKGQGIPPSVCTNLNITEVGAIRKLTWNDPKNTVIDMFTLCTWAGTQIRKNSAVIQRTKMTENLLQILQRGVLIQLLHWSIQMAPVIFIKPFHIQRMMYIAEILKMNLEPKYMNL